MPERRYSRYKRADVWIQLANKQVQERTGVAIVPDTVYGHSVTIQRDDKDYRAVVLARSSDWYYYRLNCTKQFQHGIECVICGTHDSCIDRPVLALDALRWYEPRKMRADLGELEPKLDAQGEPVPDEFDRVRKSQYGHNMLIGALMQQRPDALRRLTSLKEPTRLRIEAE